MTEESKKEFKEYYEEHRERERRKSQEKQKQSKASTSPPQPSPPIPESTVDKTQIQKFSKEEPVEIPVIELKESAISFKTAPLALDYPKRGKELPLMVPRFRASPPTFKFVSVKLDTSFSTERKILPIVIPKIKLLKPVIEFSEGKLDVDYSVSKQEREIFVPRFVTQKPLISFKMAPLNIEVPTFQSNQLVQSSAQVKTENIKVTNLIQPQEETTQGVVEVHVGNKEPEIKGEKLKDPLEFLFGKGVGKIRNIEPLVILFKDHENDSYIQTFETLLLRIYREKHGGYPDVKKLSLINEWNRREIEQWLDEGKLFLIELDKRSRKGEETIEAKLNAEMLADRLWAIFSKKKGIVIFYTKDEELFNEYKNILKDIVWNKLHLGAEIVEVIPRKLSFKEKLKLADLLFGFVNMREEAPPNASMDAILNVGENKYKDKLVKLKEKYYDILGIVKPGENESEEHLRGKAFIVHWLIRQLEEKGIVPKGEGKDWKFIRDTIRTEEPRNGVIVDVYFNNENYEFETLFEEGFGKIHKTLRKYEQLQAKVRIIVEPITAFLHVKEFAELMRIVKQMYPTLDVRFYTLDVKNENLVPLEKYLKEVETLIGQKSELLPVVDDEGSNELTPHH
ncbi:hypothetical protein [Pyrococcus horikoshii]|nr:hypothetical protein [Pyrococcus horikoshii]HII60193.1 hypothetical protein [Pyrococcus horikoshii]